MRSSLPATMWIEALAPPLNVLGSSQPVPRVMCAMICRSSLVVLPGNSPVFIQARSSLYFTSRLHFA